MTIKLYVSTGGGIGDALYDYFIRDTWGMIEPTKRKFPDSSITIVSLSHCSSTVELFKFHPSIDAIFSYPWNPPGHPKEHFWKELLSSDIQDIKQFANKNKISSDDTRTLYLSKQEEQQAESILEKPIIAIHPFAGGRHRSFLRHSDNEYHCLPENKCVEICNRLAKEGYRVVVLGKSEIIEHGRNYDETLHGLNPEVLDLSNKISARLAVHLVRKAQAFFGTHSSMLVAAWTADVPSLCFYPTLEENGKNLSIENNGGHTGTFALHKPIHLNYQLSSEGFANLDTQEIYNRFIPLLEMKKQ